MLCKRGWPLLKKDWEEKFIKNSQVRYLAGTEEDTEKEEEQEAEKEAEAKAEKEEEITVKNNNWWAKENGQKLIKLLWGKSFYFLFYGDKWTDRKCY